MNKVDKDLDSPLGNNHVPAIRDLINGNYTIMTIDPEKLKENYLGKPFTLEVFNEILEILHITIKENLAIKEIEVLGLDNGRLRFKDRNTLKTLAIKLQSLYKGIGLTRCSENDVYNYIYLAAKENSYNPIIEMFEEDIPTDNNFEILCEILGIRHKTNEKKYLEMYLGQSVALQYNWTREHPIGADFILVLLGAQGIGKTSFFRRLAVKSEWLTEGQTIDTNKKDDIMIATRRPFCELGEFDSTTKKKQSSLKSFFTNSNDEYRVPYDKSSSVWPRTTSFAATVNETEFLHDLTGSRRYLTITLDRIDKDRLYTLPDSFFQGVWREAYLKYKEDPDHWRMDDDMIALTTRRNEEFRRKTRYETEIEESLDWEQDVSLWEDITATKLLTNLTYYSIVPVSADVRDIGKALKTVIKHHPDAAFKRSGEGRVYRLPKIRDEILMTFNLQKSF